MSTFNGSDYIPSRDDERLANQLQRVWEVMRSGEWLTLGEIASRANAPQSSASAQLRHLRKSKFGAHTIEKRYEGNGLFAYRMTVNPEAVQMMARAA